MKQLFKYLSVLMLLIATFAIPAKAAVGDVWKSGDLWYQEATGGQAKVIAPPAGSNPYSGSIIIPPMVQENGKNFLVRIIAAEAFRGADITSIELPNTLSEIGANAFLNTHLTYLELPNSNQLTKIGDGAFQCNLKTLVVPAASIAPISNKNFQNQDLKSIIVDPANTRYCSYDGVLLSKDKTKLIIFPAKKNVGEYTIPSSVTELADRSFYRAQISKLTIPDNVINLGKNTFANTNKLTNIKIGKGVIVIPDSTFYCAGSTGDKDLQVTLEGDVTEIGKMAFTFCTVKSINFPKTLKKIGDYAFCATELNGITLPENLEEIGYRAFDSSGIETLVLPPFTKLGDGVFNACVWLKSVFIQEGRKELPTAAFAGCPIEVISLPASLEKLGDQAFYANYKISKIMVAPGNQYFTVDDNVLFSKDKKTLLLYCTGNKEVSQYSVPTGVTRIATGAFSCSDYLAKVHLPESLDSLGVLSFYDCPNLTEINIPEKVKYISKAAFKGCESIPSIKLHNNIIGIMDEAFYATKFLADFQLPTNLKIIGNSAFYNAFTNKNTVELDFPETLETIGSNAFQLCHLTGKVNIPKSVKNWGEDSFTTSAITEVEINSQCTTPPFAFSLCPSIRKVTIGPDVPAIGNNLFDTYTQMISIKEVKIEEGLKSIGKAAFPGLFKSMTIPNSVDSIDYYYCNSPNLKFLKLGSGIKVLGFAGEETVNLETIICEAKTAPKYNDHNSITQNYITMGGLFMTETYSKATLYVPTEAIEDYKQAPYWNRFLNIKSIDDYNGVSGIAADNTTVTVSGREITVEGTDKLVGIHDISGKAVYSGAPTTVAMPAAGVYIVRVGDKSYKVMVK